MKKYLFIESEKPNKSGHVAHIMCYHEKTNSYYEVSPLTGKELRNGLWLTNLNNYKIINPFTDKYFLTGARRYLFRDFLIDNPEYIQLSN